MAEILSSLVKPAMEELGRITVVKIKHLFTYLCFFNNNIQSLRNEAEELEDARVGLQRQVEAAENDAQVILPEVRTWLENASTKIQADMRRIDDRIPTVKNGCWGVKSRFRLSREAVKITGEMKQLMEKRKQITDIATPAPPVARAEIPLGITNEFDSRKQIEEDIMNALKAKKVTTMGICGMGGVGKTTMAKRIMVRVKKENIFEEVFMVVISQQADLLRIQDEIAEPLGLMLVEKTLQARASKIRARLMSTKRILIVIDDVWEKLKLEDLGISCGNERCTILLTSRNKDVLKEMDAQKIFGVEILSDKEAWSLFREKTGSCVDDPNLLSTAKKVARQCKGLPIALITVGGALKDQTNITFWEDALQQLKSFNPEDIPSFIKNVYNPLKLSYTKLESRRAKSLFLLCSLFPEDADISLEELTSYCIGLQMFSNLDFSNASEGILEIARKRVFTIVDMLKNHFLLLNGRDEHHVKMHDVVRDVAIYIATHEAKEGMIVDVKFNSMRLSSEYTYHWGSVILEETSSFLRMQGLNWYRNFEIKDFSIFEGIKQLSLLAFQYIIMKSIPLEIQLLKNLRTLRLVGCMLESNFSMVGKFLSLEILDCYGCDGIEELPVEIGNLNQLKQLDFSYCMSLRRIPPGVISNLVELEEFKMLDSFNGWELAGAAEAQGQERRNACLNEFANLSKLTRLEIHVTDINLAVEEISFSPNIVSYHIAIGDIAYMYDPSHGKVMWMNLPGDISLGSWVVRFLKSANELYLKGDGSSPLDLRQSHSMKSLRFEYCSTVKKLVNSTTSIHNPSEFDVFPILENLWLSNCPNLEEIYDGAVLDHSNSFRNLKWLYLDDLRALKHLWKRSNRSIVSLHNLRQIWIINCNKFDSLFPFTNSIGTGQISTAPRNVDELLCTQTVFFPMLEEMMLRKLDKLEVIWNSPIPDESHSFKNLRELKIYDLPVLTHLWKSPNLSVSLNSLSQIQIDGCHKLRNIFSSTIMSMDFLLQLTKFEIKNCEMMKQVVLNENDENQYRTIHFPKLLKLTLNFLESLTVFGKGVESIEFAMLEEMKIIDCPKLMSLLFDLSNQNSANDHDKHASHLFCNQKISFGSLRVVQIERCEGITSLFLSSLAENLVNLEELRIYECKKMIKVIVDDEEMSLCEKPRLLFPNLKELELWDLPKLKCFSNWRCDLLQLPLLEKLNIRNCPVLQFFIMKSVTTPKLEEFIIDNDKKEVRDLNAAIQLHFETNQCPQLISPKEESILTEASEVDERSQIEEEEIE